MEEIDLKELFSLFVEKKVQIALIILIFIILGFIYSLGFVTPMYESYTTLLLVEINFTNSKSLILHKMLYNFSVSS